MAWVETRITRTAQPQDAVGIDWGNPLAQGLTSAWWGDSNFIGPAGANKLGAYRVVGSVGAGRFITAGSVTVLPANSFGHTESESRLAVVKVPSGTNRNISSTNATGSVQLRTSGNDLVYVEKGVAVKITASGVLSTGETCVVGVSRDASTAKLYKSGRLLGTSVGRALAASTLPAIGQDGTGGGQFEGDIYLHLAWRRVLSDIEFLAISQNPWQIFEPEVQRVWVDDYVSAGGGATGTLAATETGSDTAVISGQIVVQGTLSATEAGSDTSAVTGGIVVQGSLAATEVGSDTALINGSSAIVTTGSINATESGGDGASMAGKVLVTGAVSGQELGSDTASLAGAAAVTGVRYWNGATWAYGTLRYWDGSAWGTGTLRYWNGTNWSIP